MKYINKFLHTNIIIKGFLVKILKILNINTNNLSRKFCNFNFFINEKNIVFNEHLKINKKLEKTANIANKISLCGPVRILNLLKILQYLKNKKIRGDIVEAGVFKGGNLIILNKFISIEKLKKKIYAFDTFEGMTKPTKDDKDLFNKYAKFYLKEENKDIYSENIHCFSNLEETKLNILRTTKNLNNFKFIKGDVTKTLEIKKNIPSKISLLILDVDFYKPTKKLLEVLYPKLEKNGVLIIDDYGHWQGCKKACDEYFKNKNVMMFVIDYTARCIIKN